MKVLFVTPEVYPLNKTGGLGDVAYSLPHALKVQGADVRLIIPAYRDLLDKLQHITFLKRMDIVGANCVHSVRVALSTHEEFDISILLVDCQGLYDRAGNPYLDPDGNDWYDNAERFTVFSRVVAEIAEDESLIGWKPDVVHCNDWQTGLVPALIKQSPHPPKTVFTIHNMAYGGYFNEATYRALQLPDHLWHMEGVEFYNSFSMLKSGIVYSDIITTVSPTYAREICTPEFGNSMDGVLRARSERLFGILNGIDERHWNPQTDNYLPSNYSVRNYQAGKQASKKLILQSYGVAQPNEQQLGRPLLGMVGRLVEQKGVDLIVDSLEDLMTQTDANFIFLGTGAAQFEVQLTAAAEEYPERIFVSIGFSEEKAHLIEAGADMFMMPSRFEPCGLNQMYSLRYGTPPIVHKTGGLADTVVNTTEATLADGTANGFTFPTTNISSFQDAVKTALQAFSDSTSWQSIVENGMTLDLSWEERAKQYLELYNS